MENYEKLEKVFSRLHHLEHLGSITMWDEESKMPEGGGDARALALTELGLIEHEIINDPGLSSFFEKGQKEVEESGSDWQKSNFNEMKKYWKEATCLDKDLVEKKSLANMKCAQKWRELRAKNDWEGYLPFQQEVLNLAKDEANARSKSTELSPYDSLMDLYEPGIYSAEIEKVFGELKDFLPEFIKKVEEKQKKKPYSPPKGPFPTKGQKELGLALMKQVGFDFNHGRLDESHHPFCGGVPDDVRITTRYDEENFEESLMGVLHETGHAKYEQGLPKEWRTQPVGKARGMAFHEAQSLLMEMQICRSYPFLKFAAPYMAKAFGASENVPEFSPENLYRGQILVKRDYIRVNADEVTYPLHVILRFEIEKDLISGALDLKELPKVWNEKMTQYLGISTLGNDKDGCMQDGHWSSGAFGYFPSYTMGALIAAQLFGALRKDLPDVDSQIEKGEFKDLDGWLREKIWSKGCLLSGPDLLKNATGEILNPQYFIDHLINRYLS